MKVYVCKYPECDKKFFRPSKLQFHHNLHTGFRPFKCLEAGCTKSYFTSSHLQRHLKCHSNQVSTSKVEYLCTYSSCQATFETLWGLQRHEIKHFSKLICESCKKYFQTLTSYQKHLQTHEERQNRKCRFCGESFAHKSKRELTRHEKKHSYLKCGVCPRMFKNLDFLHRHLVNHEHRFECAHCGLITSSKNSLRNHISSMHIKFATPSVCEFKNCWRVYHYKRNLLRHSASHSEENQFKCKVSRCHQTFIHKNSYLRHLELHRLNRIKVKESRKKIDFAAELTNSICNCMI